MKKSKNVGFSLIELLVVVAIIAALATIALPIYRVYSIRAKLGQDIAYLMGLEKALITYFETHGAYPATISYGNGTFPNNAVVTAGLPADFVNIRWITFGGNNNIYIQTNMNGGALGFSPTNLYGTNNINLAVQYSKNSIINTCGVYSPGDANSIDLEYLPSWCTNTNMAGCANTGVC